MSSGGVGAIPARRYAERLDAAQSALARDGAAALLVGVGADLRWLAGYAAHPLERLTCLVVPRDGRPVLVVPRLEEPAARHAPVVEAGLVDVASWDEVEDPFALAASRLALADGRSAGTSRALVSDTIRASFLLRFQEALPGVRFGLASSVLAPLRMVKQVEEVELLRAAAHAADRALEGVIRGRLVGRTEADVAREVRQRLEDEGHDAASFWIVASGPNSASPHHDPGDREIRVGEPVVFDIGGTLAGYGSDITRTAWVAGDGEVAPDATFRHLYRVLQDAQRLATERVRPEVPCEAIDAAAREHIERHGYGDRFIHRTGHGIGLEGHEEPYLVAGNELPLAVGHAFSVEPGIYLEGRYGARIEDIVVCGPEGADVLNQAPRELLVVSGL